MKQLASIAQVLLALFVALPVYIVARLSRRVLRLSSTSPTRAMSGGQPKT